MSSRIDLADLDALDNEYAPDPPPGFGEDDNRPAAHMNGVDGAAGATSGAAHVDPVRVRVGAEIKITTALRENVDDAIAALRVDENLYQRDGRLVHVTRVSRAESEASPQANVGAAKTPHRALVEGSPQIRELAIPTLTERLAHCASFKKWKQGRRKDGSDSAWVGALPSSPIVSAVFHRGGWTGIPQIVGIVEAPVLRPDGSVCQEPGYDPSTGYLYVPGEAFPEVPEAPTQEDARVALARLQEPFVDFPYVSDAHRAVPIAAVLTLLARPAIQGSTPAFAFDASTRGSGKTLQSDAIAIIATGRGAPRMNFPVKVYITSHGQSCSVNDEEMEKILAAYALRGASLICLDNVVAPFGGAPLDRVLTARDLVELRVLGRTEVPAVPWRAVILPTGNNMQFLLDTARRVLRSRLESPLENPEARTNFRHPDLIGWLRTERANLVVAALTVLRAYVVAGRPDMKCERWGSFEEWSALIPAAIVFAGGADPMGARVTGDSDRDDDTAALATILVQLPKLQAAAQLGLDPSSADAPTAQEILVSVYPDGGDGPPPDRHRELRLALESLVTTKRGAAPSAKALSKALGRLRGRVVHVALDAERSEDRRLVADLNTHTKTLHWRAETVQTGEEP
jgi:hypothetical protein